MRRLLTAAVGAVLMAACSSDSPPATSSSRPATSSASQAASALPEGVYRTDALTWDDLAAAIKAAGFSTEDAARVRPIFEFRKNVVFTLKLQGGQWTEFESDDGGPDQVGDLGTHTVTGDVLAMTGDSGEALQHFKWTLDGAALSLQPRAGDPQRVPGDPQRVGPDSVAVFTSGPFYRAG
jgi:hypothetical protein